MLGIGNFIDKTFTVIADLILKLFPASKKEKEAFSYYRAGMNAQSTGKYSEALSNYYEALKREEDAMDRGFVLFNMGLIYKGTGRPAKSLDFFQQALELNPNSTQALNAIAVIYHQKGMQADSLYLTSYNDYQLELAEIFYDTASKYWIRSLKIAPDLYPGARNWLKVTGRLPDGI